ncbi:MAG: hypothetical protein QOG71_697 [Pyrinomonadaceae bacterium]|nr:hypothetical protein [Pyrinomonadaceae bacterium]
MYCPRCAVQNLDDAKFCRGCGADIRLVPQALQGTLQPAALERFENGEVEEGGKKKKRRPATVDEALKSLFTGFGLFIIFLIGIFAFRGAFWVTIWFIIPALANIGEGIGQLIRARQEQTRLSPPATGSGADFRPAAFAPAPVVAPQLPSPDTREIVSAPASVTDGTTRHLDAPSKTP